MSADSDLVSDPLAEVASAPALEPADIPAIYYDGTSSRKRQVTLRPGIALEIVENGAVVATWPFAEIRRADGGRRIRLSCLSALPPTAFLSSGM